MAAPGYRFCPTDEELVSYYLRFKMLGYDDQVRLIAELNVCDFEPWELPNHSTMQSDDQVWYFFCPRVCKYSNSQRANRTTTAGYWKVTGKDRKVKSENSEEDIAVKKILVFYEGRVPSGVKTSWVMHEYNPTFSLPNQRNFVLCKLKRNSDDVLAIEEGEATSQIPCNYSTQVQHKNNSDEEDIQMQAHLDSFRGYNEMDYSLNSAFPTQMQSSPSDGCHGGTYGSYGSSVPGQGTFYGSGDSYH